MSYVVPIILAALILYAVYKKVNVYDCFVDGGKEGLKLTASVFPYISAVMILIAMFKVSGLAGYFSKIMEKPLALFGIPAEVAELLLIRPLSGSGSIALLENIFNEYGADSYVGRVAAVIMSSTETILYIGAIYFSGVKIKKLRGAVIISIAASFFGAVAAVWLCRL